MLTLIQQKNFVDLIDAEISVAQCLTVPKYQSFADMHAKHCNSEELATVKNAVLSAAYGLTGKWLAVRKCWFNVLRQDSDYEYHTHLTLTGVYLLANCENNGTLLSCDDRILQLPARDNTLEFIGAGVLHSVPSWAGVDRYSVAFELIDGG